LICDGEGTPLAVTVTPGQEHETQQFVPLMEEATAWPEQPEKLAGDKGYSAEWIRDWLKEHDIEAVIPYKTNEKGRRKKFNRKGYRRRNIIERCVSSLKWFRRRGHPLRKTGHPLPWHGHPGNNIPPPMIEFTRHDLVLPFTARQSSRTRLLLSSTGA